MWFFPRVFEMQVPCTRMHQHLFCDNQTMHPFGVPIILSPSNCTPIPFSSVSQIMILRICGRPAFSSKSMVHSLNSLCLAAAISLPFLQFKACNKLKLYRGISIMNSITSGMHTRGQLASIPQSNSVSKNIDILTHREI